MTKETQDQNNPLAPYGRVAGDVVGLIGDRANANGDPETFGAVLGGLLEVYTRAVVPTRPLGAVDAFVFQVLESVAYMVSGGVQAQRFRDMTAAALAGSVHVERVMEAMRAHQAAQGGQEAPQAAPEEPDDGEGFKPAPDAADAFPYLANGQDDQEGDVRAVLAERERAVADVVRESLEADQDDQDDQEGDVRAGPRPLQVREGEEVPRYGTPGQVVVGVARDGRTQRIGSFSASGDFVATKVAGDA